VPSGHSIRRLVSEKKAGASYSLVPTGGTTVLLSEGNASGEVFRLQENKLSGEGQRQKGRRSTCLDATERPKELFLHGGEY